MNGTIVVSQDNGKSWSLANSNTTDWLWSIAYANDTFVAVGDNGDIVVGKSST